jgi:pyruvate-ferredoxin/flavodoxin oxidoreductase
MRYNPEVRLAGENPFSLDSPRPTIKLTDYADQELRYRMLHRTNPKEAKMIMDVAQRAIEAKWKLYEEMAAMGHD